MLRLVGPSLTEPLTFGLCHRLATKRVLTHQPGQLQLLLDDRERCCRRLFFLFGNFTGEGHDEPETVLQVVQLDLRHGSASLSRGSRSGVCSAAKRSCAGLTRRPPLKCVNPG